MDGGLALAGSRGPRGVRRFSHDAMNTVFEIHAVHADPGYAAQAAHAAFDLLDRLERELSRFLVNSDIARVNHLEAGGSTRVGTSAMECLVIARHVFALTGGAFDVSIGTGLEALELDTDASIVRKTRGGVAVDLGGIGKGYAVDRLAELLEEWGVTTALVHGGFSSVLALDAPSGSEGWPLNLSDPAAPSRVLERLSLVQATAGASGMLKGAHIRDPRTGRPVEGRAGAWVSIPRPEAARGDPGLQDGPRMAASAVTDALTTAFMLMDLEEIAALCEATPGLRAWILAEGDPSVEPPAVRRFGGPAA